jgi:arylsulfatase A-like enzyme
VSACGSDQRPDVLLVVLDTVRADHLSAYGYARRTTPVLEALAAEGVRYDLAITTDTWTVPTHASLFTGLLPSSHGAYRTAEGLDGVHALDPSIETLAERLRAAGYRTAAFLGNDAYLDPALGMDRGFERYQTENTRPAGRLVWAAQRWLRRHGRRPTFLFLNVLDAHQPYRPQPPYDRLFPGKLDGVEPHPTERLLATGQPPDAATMAHYVSQYDGELRYVDDRLEELFATYRQLGRWDDALVIVTADHGELFEEHGMLGHGGPPYHGLVRVPLLVKYPHDARRGIVRDPVSLADVAPTVLATVGLPPLASSGPPLWERRGPVMAETMLAGGGVIRAVYDGSGRVLMDREDARGRETVVYDLATDPGQTRPQPASADGTAADLVVAAGELIARTPRRPPGPLVHLEADTELTQRLRALGYVE